MKSQLKSWQDFHHRINLFYHAIIAVSLIPFALVFLDIDSGGETSSQIELKYEWFVIAILLATVLTVCLKVWRNARVKLESIDSSLEIKMRLITYFNFQIQRYFQLEIGALISLMGLWLTANYIFVAAYIMVLVQFSLLRPSQDRVIRDLRFNPQEREHLKGEKL